MTVINNEKNTLTIILHETEPEERKEKIMKALLAAARWYTISDDDAKYNVNNVDSNNLYELVRLHEDLFNQSK